MTVVQQTTQFTYLGNGIATDFPFTCQIDTLGEVGLYLVDANGLETPVSIALATVTGLGDEGGGSIHYPIAGSPVAYPTSLRIRRQVPYEQDTSLTNQDTYYPAVLETALDNLCKQIQQLADLTTGASAQQALAAAAQAVAILASINSLNMFYQGALASDPATRVSGGALQAGDFYFNTVVAQIRTYNGSAWQATNLAGALQVVNNLSDITNKPLALSNLGAAGLVSPVFTGDPQAPTPAVGDSDTSIATTGYVKAVTPYTKQDSTVTTIGSGRFVSMWNGSTGEKILVDNFLNSKGSHLRVTSFCDGDHHGITTAAAVAMACITADGTPWAWGVGTNYVNGDTNQFQRWFPKELSFAPGSTPVFPIIQIARSASSMYVLDSAGNVYAQGNNAGGQLGLGDTTVRRQLTLITYFPSNSLTVAKIILPGAAYGVSTVNSAFFLMTNNQLYGVGGNAAGQLGNGNTTQQTSPVRCGTLTNIVKVEASQNNDGFLTVGALDSTNNLYLWGRNNFGQVANGNTTDVTVPYFTLATAVDFAINAGFDGTTYGCNVIAVLNAGTVYGVGYNFYGQIGDGTTTNRTAWTQTLTIGSGKAVFTGGGQNGSCGVILTDNTIRVWGYNVSGVLGDGSNTSRSSPVNPSGAFQGKVTSILFCGCTANAEQMTAVLTTDGQVWTSGANADGRLGLANGFTATNAFARIGFPANAATVVTKLKFTGSNTDGSLFMLMSDGSVYATGANNVGQLGTHPGNLHSISVPERTVFV